MKLKVKFYSDLRDKYAPENRDGIVELTLGNNAKIKDVFDALHIDEREVGFVLLNEDKVQKEDDISDHDFIHIFPLVAGG